MLSISVGAEPLLEGRVRLESGEPVANAQVRIFDMTDLRQGPVARAQTDGTGYFALPLAALTGSVLPARFTLGQNYPNPFNPSTIIPYHLAASSEVQLEVFNLLGQHIATLVDEERAAGFHTATWYAIDAAGRAVGAGVYVYRMTVGVESQTGRMVLIDGQAGVSAGGLLLFCRELPGAACLMKRIPKCMGWSSRVTGWLPMWIRPFALRRVWLRWSWSCRQASLRQVRSRTTTVPFAIFSARSTMRRKRIVRLTKGGRTWWSSRFRWSGRLSCRRGAPSLCWRPSGTKGTV